MHLSLRKLMNIVMCCSVILQWLTVANINRRYNLHCGHVITVLVSICSLLHCTAETPLANHIVTDSQDKGKDSVFTFINRLVDLFAGSISEGDTLVISTDGPSSEFKNNYT